MICEICIKDVLDCPCDIEFIEPILRNIKGDICPRCEQKVYSNGIHMCGEEGQERHDITLCLRCYCTATFLNGKDIKIPNRIDDLGHEHKLHCQCEIPDVR